MSTTKRPPSPPLKRPARDERNARPWGTTLLLAAILFVLLIVVGSFFASTKSGPENLGMAYGASIPGFIALGIWARGSRTRWGVGQWLARALLCVIASVAGVAAFVLLGTAINVR